MWTWTAWKIWKGRKENGGTGEGYQKLSWVLDGAGRDPDASTGMYEGARFAMFYLISYYSICCSPRVQWAAKSPLHAKHQIVCTWSSSWPKRYGESIYDDMGPAMNERYR